MRSVHSNFSPFGAPIDNNLCNYCTNADGAIFMIRFIVYRVMQSFAEQMILDVVNVHPMDFSISG